MFKIGNGIDIHRLTPGKHLVIGGVLIESPFGFEAHSDGDILVHALCDALLGALGLPDIGHQFPDSDPAWRGAFSLETFLPKVWDKVKGEGYVIQNMDATVVLEKPKLAPYIGQMRKNLSACLHVAESCIGIKATRSEGCLYVDEKHAGLALVNVLLGKEIN